MPKWNVTFKAHCLRSKNTLNSNFENGWLIRYQNTLENKFFYIKVTLVM